MGKEPSRQELVRAGNDAGPVVAALQACLAGRDGDTDAARHERLARLERQLATCRACDLSAASTMLAVALSQIETASADLAAEHRPEIMLALALIEGALPAILAATTSGHEDRAALLAHYCRESMADRVSRLRPDDRSAAGPGDPPP